MEGFFIDKTFQILYKYYMRITKIYKKKEKEFFPPETKANKTDFIYFICENCENETRKEKRKIDNNYPYCTSCLRKIKNKEKYGVENVFQLDSVKNKSKQTKKKKYGDENFSNKEKAKTTLIEKYGVDSPLKLDKAKENRKNINQEAVNSKRAETNKSKYGVENIFQLEEVQRKQKDTLVKKYGVDSPLKSEEIKERRKSTCIERYGEDYPKVLSNNGYSKVIDRLDKVEPLFSENEYDNVKKKYEWRCIFCGNVFIDGVDNGREPRCPKCSKRVLSQPELEINDFIESLGFTTEVHNREIIKPMELDILIPEKNIAIEYNGLYWHSEQKIGDKYYHIKKTDIANKNNLRLIHIFEDEWLYKSSIVKNRLKSILGENRYRVGGRETSISEISSKQKNDFLERYHIQGQDSSVVKIGAFKGDVLISVMTFSKPRISLGQKSREDGVWELSRFASVSDTYAPGVASKLFSYFLDKYFPKMIYTYSDVRWNTGILYKNLGMKYLGRTNPNYWYIEKNRKRSHRFKYRKQVLKEKLSYFNEDLTEYENMLQNNYDRIWDCGNDKWEIEL